MTGAGKLEIKLQLRGRELGIKLRLGRRELDHFAALDALMVVRPEQAELHTVYFDDHRRCLATKGVELLVRTSGSRPVTDR
jgi:hypothetical protein